MKAPEAAMIWWGWGAASYSANDFSTGPRPSPGDCLEGSGDPSCAV